MLKNFTEELYQAISFHKGSAPNYAALKSRFLQEGILINNKGEAPVIKTIDKYVEFIKGNVEAGNILALTESEISSCIEIYGDVGNITSRYQLLFEISTGVFVRYGINLIQVIRRDSQWYISSMCWDDREDQSMFA
jgi:hypothetical protein